MKTSEFSTASPGSLVPMNTVWGPDHAFIPDPLPPASWEFPTELWPLLAEAKQQIGILDGIGRTLANPAILLKPLRDREAILSSEIEGTFATARELFLFEMEPKQSQRNSSASDEVREVANYAAALDFAMESELPLCLRLIKELHSILMTGTRGGDHHPGEFRQVPVGIRSGKFIPPPNERLMEFLDPLEDFGNLPKTQFDPIVDCFLFHYQFEAIHPFQDGNDRVGRLLLTYMIQRRCELSKPWIHMSDFFEKHRDEYYEGLYEISTKGNWSYWIKFCLEGVYSQSKSTIKRCEQLLELQVRFKQQLTDVGGSVRLNSIVDDLFISPLIKLADLPDKLGVTYMTAKSDVKRLVKAGILKEIPDLYPKYFFAPDIYNISYEELDR